MKSVMVFTLLVFLEIGRVFAAIDDDPPSHCAKNPNIPMALDEVTVFACRIGEKTLSLCAYQSKDLGGYQTMSYHFGRLGQPEELVYPKKPMPVWKAFKVSSLSVERQERSSQFREKTIGWYRNKAAEAFEQATGLALPSGSYAEIAFSSGPYAYTIYYQITANQVSKEPENKGFGLVIEKNAAVIAHLPCSAENLSEVNAGIEGRYFPRRMGHLIKGLYRKNDFKDAAKYFRGVAPQNQRFKKAATGQGG